MVARTTSSVSHRTWSYADVVLKEFVDLKVIRNKKKFQHQAGVEVKILKHLRDNDKNDDNNIKKAVRNAPVETLSAFDITIG